MQLSLTAAAFFFGARQALRGQRCKQFSAQAASDCFQQDRARPTQLLLPQGHIGVDVLGGPGGVQEGQESGSNMAAAAAA